MFAEGLYDKSEGDVRQICIDNNNPEGAKIFENSTKPLDADIYKGGIYLGCKFGAAALYIWAIGILAAGQSSTMTGTYSGQFVMEGFLNLKWARWMRVLLTRSIAILPTVIIATTKGINDLTGMNDLLNALMSLQLPFALIPTITFTNSKHIMGDFCNGLANKIMSCVLAVVVIAINMYFVGYYVILHVSHSWVIITLVVIVVWMYLAFVIYLVLYLLASLGFQRLPRQFLVKLDLNQMSMETAQATPIGSVNTLT